MNGGNRIPTLESRTPRARLTTWLACAAALVAGVVASACDRVPLFAPANSTLTITADSRQLSPGGSTGLTVMVLEPAGTVVQNGTTVTFTSSLGRVDPVEVQTRNGIATATFFAGETSGTATVRATSGSSGGGTTSGGGTGSTTASNAVDILIGSAGTTAVVLSASPSTVPSSGGTVTITAAAVDANGNRLRGAPVSFSTTNGTLSAASAVTDANGEASVQLTTNRTATVTARAGNQSATVTVNVAQLPAITLAVTPAAPVVGQPVSLTITPTIGTNAVAPSVTVNWGDGTTETLGTVGGARTVTHTYNAPGSYTINVTATSEGETTSNSIAVTVAPRPVIGVTITANVVAGTRAVNFTATLTPTGTADLVESYTWDFGDGTETTTTSNSTSHTYSDSGVKTVRVTVRTSDGRTATGQTSFNIP